MNLQQIVMDVDAITDPQTPETACRILVADDEPSMREFTTDALAFGGYHAVAVDGGVAALEALKTEPYDLVLTDLNMPNGSGADLIIKIHSEGFNIPVIMMTGAALTKELTTMISMLHAGTILQKPFRIDQLLAAVDHALRPMPNRSNDSANKTPVRRMGEETSRHLNG